MIPEPLASSVVILRKLTDVEKAYYRLQAAEANLSDPDFRVLVNKLDAQLLDRTIDTLTSDEEEQYNQNVDLQM